MPGVGYAEGYLSALQQISGVQEHQQQMQLRGMQMQQMRQQAEENRQEKQVLADAFRTAADQQQTGELLGQEDRLAMQYKIAGQRLMGVNPRDALQLLQEGSRITEQSYKNRLEQARAEKLRGEYLAAKASTVEDQAGLDDYVRQAAKEGQVVPRQYQQWNETTRRYLERAVRASMPISKQQELALRTEEMKLKAEAEGRKQQAEEQKEALAARREARLQAGMEIKQRAAGAKATSDLGLHGEKDREAEMQVLTDLDKKGLFKALPPGRKLEAVQDVRLRAQRMYADSLMSEEPLDKEEALRMAREEVLGELIQVKEGGIFTKAEAGREPAKAGAGAPKQGEIVSISSDEEYNKLPSGTTFKGPDGKLRRKP